MATFLGYDLLDQTTPNMRDAIAQAFSRAGDLVGSEVGRKVFDDFIGYAVPVRSFSWLADGRTEVAALQAFLDARKGRIVPFWTPTYCGEVPLYEDKLAAASSLRVPFFGYTRFLFPQPWRRYLAIVPPGGAYFVRKVSTATDNGDGTETLTLTAALGVDVPKGWLVSYLTFCRLEADRTKIRWHGPFKAETIIDFRERPNEAP